MIPIDEILVTWALVTFSDVCAFSIIFRIMYKRWWFKPECDVPFRIIVSADSWSISGRGMNPIASLIQWIEQERAKHGGT